MTKRLTSAEKPRDWGSLAFDSWMLWGDAAMVVWLRSVKMMAGGAPARAEAERMVGEKIAANASFAAAVMTGRAGTTPEAVTARALSHYGTTVRANRKRLSGG